MDYQIINGQVLSKEEALIPLSDLGLLRGYSVFDFFRVIDGVPIFLEDHLDRLFNSMEIMGIEPIWTRKELGDMCVALVFANSAERAGLRIVVTGGFSADGYTPQEPNVYMTLHDLPQYNPEDYSKGRKLIVSGYTRDMPEVKTTSYAHAIKQRKRMLEHDAVEVLYHTDGTLTECSRSNIFFIDNAGALHTPDSNMLRGITRKQVIALTEGRYGLTERDVSLEEIPTMAEAFITSSTKGVLPIVQIGDTVIGNGTPGKLTVEIHHLFLDHVRHYINSHTPHGQQV